MRSNYTELLAWLPATASFTVQVQVCGSACVCGVEVESVWSAFVQVLSKYFVVVALMRAQIRAVGVNVRTSVLTERYRKGVSPESLGAWMAAFTKEQRSLNLSWQEPRNVQCQRPDHSHVLPSLSGCSGSCERGLHGAAFLLHKSARWRWCYNLRGRWGVRPQHTSGSQCQELGWSDGVWMCRDWLTFLFFI